MQLFYLNFEISWTTPCSLPPEHCRFESFATVSYIYISTYWRKWFLALMLWSMCYGSTKRVKRKGYQIIIHEKSGNFYEIFRKNHFKKSASERVKVWGGRGGGLWINRSFSFTETYSKTMCVIDLCTTEKAGYIYPRRFKQEGDTTKSL